MRGATMLRAARLAALAAALDPSACRRLLPAIAACNRLDGTLARCPRTPPLEAEAAGATLVPLVVDGAQVGALQPRDAEALAEHGAGVFEVSATRAGLVADLEKAGFEARNAAVEGVARKLHDAGVVSGWRDELVPVTTAWEDPPAFAVERAAYPFLGAKGFGCHVNAFVPGEGGDLCIWVGRRAATKQTWPGLLDHLAAGQLPLGQSPRECVLAELAEEAGVPEAIARTAQQASLVSCRGLSDFENRLMNDNIFAWDLELAPDFRPKPVDGEVDSFELRTVGQVVDDIEAAQFKPNVALVIIDFLVRRKFLHDGMPDFDALLDALKNDGGRLTAAPK